MNETVVEVLEPRNNSVPLTLCVGLTGDFMFERDVQFVVVPEELTTEDVDEQALRKMTIFLYCIAGKFGRAFNLVIVPKP